MLIMQPGASGEAIPAMLQPWGENEAIMDQKSAVLMVVTLWWYGFELKYFMAVLLGGHRMPMAQIYSKMAILDAMKCGFVVMWAVGCGGADLG